MSCKHYQHQITLLLYDELPESTRVELETHLQNCPNCHDAYESEKTMHSVLAEDAAQWDNIPSDLLVESRRALAGGAGAVDSTPKLVRALGPRALEPPDVTIEDLRSRATAAPAAPAAAARAGALPPTCQSDSSTSQVALPPATSAR